MKGSIKYRSAVDGIDSLNSVIPKQLVEATTKALSKLKEALGGDVSAYVSHRLHLSLGELKQALAAEQVDGVALAMYNIEKRGQAIIIGDQTGIGKGRQAAAMIRYGLLSGYLPIFFTERYTLFSDIYRDCKALGIHGARPLIVNAGASVVDFDELLDEAPEELPSPIWLPDNTEAEARSEKELMQLYEKQYKVVYKAPSKKVIKSILYSGNVSREYYDYLMITYSQLKDAGRDRTRLDFLQALCQKHRVLFVFDEAHRSSSVSAGKMSVITQAINRLLSDGSESQCVFLSATFAKRAESLITFMRKTALSALATESTLEKALHSGGLPMQEYVSSMLASEGQMIRREHSDEDLPPPIYTYLDDSLVLHSKLFDKVMYFFRELVKLSSMVQSLASLGIRLGILATYRCYPTRSQLFYLNKVLLLSLKAESVARTAIRDVQSGRSVVIGMSDTLECILCDVFKENDSSVRGDISSLLLRLAHKTVCNSQDLDPDMPAIFDLKVEPDLPETAAFVSMAEELETYYRHIVQAIEEEVFHLPMSPIDVIRQLITQESFISPSGAYIPIRFEECTGRTQQLQYISPEGRDDYVHATIMKRKKRHVNHVFNDFQNNQLDVILINACGAIGASAHAVATSEVPEAEVRQRKMLIVQNDLDVNIDLQKRGRINRTGQRKDLPPLYEYIITAIPSEKRLNMMLRAKLRSLSANTAAYQDQDREQADFVDISNKYGNELAEAFVAEHKELALVLGLKGRTSASTLLARIAMLSVGAQQDIVDELISSYMALESELRRINQWDIEREFRDFDAEFVREELFTTALAKTKLGACSYLSTYRCKQKTFPHSYERLQELCDEATLRLGPAYKDNKKLQAEVRRYYMSQAKVIRQRFAERRRLLYVDAERILIRYCPDPTLVQSWLEAAQIPYEHWGAHHLPEVEGQKREKQIYRKLVAYCNDVQHLLDREKTELRRSTQERKRLVEILSLAVIGKGYANISQQVAGESGPERVMAVLRDIRFGKDEANRFLPSRVELVFALSAVYTELRINMVHNSKWSNYVRLREILSSAGWNVCGASWDAEIAVHNERIVERKIITGNILGAFVHPAIVGLKPRFITFSVKGDESSKPSIQHGLLLPLDEAKIRELLKTVSIPLHQGIKYAYDTNTSYCITGLGLDFLLMPLRASDDNLHFILSVRERDAKVFEEDTRFDEIRGYLQAREISSIYDHRQEGKASRRQLVHYTTEPMSFTSEGFQSIVQTLAQLDAVIIVPREQITGGEAKALIAQSEQDDREAWPMLDWRGEDAQPLPATRAPALLRISSPIQPANRKGKPVSRHSAVYLLAKDTMAVSGQSLQQRATLEALRRLFLRWKRLVDEQEEVEYPQRVMAQKVCRTLRELIEGARGIGCVSFHADVHGLLQSCLESEYLDTHGLFIARFEEEMLFLSPELSEAQAFLDDMPCSEALDPIRQSLQDYIDGRTDIINSVDKLFS